MSENSVVQFFEDLGPENYDKLNTPFKPVMENLHFLNTLILKELPKNAKILCVGVGSGADIVSLAKAYRGWTFVGIEPSESMIAGSRKKIEEEGLAERCELFHGYIHDFKSNEEFNAATCLFVMHFIKDTAKRAQMFLDISRYVKLGGYFINAELSCDLDSPEFPSLLKKWEDFHDYGKAQQEESSSTADALKDELAILSPLETKKLIQENGFNEAVEFFQSFLIRAWFARKISTKEQ